MRWPNLFKPPEWSWWTFADRAAYVISMGCYFGLMSLGVWKLKELLTGS